MNWDPYNNYLFTREEYNNSKYNDELMFLCPICGEVFSKEKFRVTYSLKNEDTHKYQYCNTCLQNMRMRQVKVECEWCGKSFFKQRKEYLKTDHHFCCKQCFGKYTASHTSIRNRSKSEVILEQWFRNELPHIHCITNDRSVCNGLELDFYLPEYNLAIEINGPHHSSPIYGEERFKETKVNDVLKQTICIKKNIHILIAEIDSYRDIESIDNLKIAILELVGSPT